jgi:PAS domain S-box-containing protein
MEPKQPEQKKNTDLRKRAEKKLKPETTAPGRMSDKETRQLIHELQVHQIELEMQNEELRKSQAELEESRTKYADLYDFAPVGYFTFDKDGLILEANLTAAQELGRERSLLMNKPFRSYIIPEDRAIFDQCLQAVFQSADRQVCELRLKRKDGSEIYAQLESISVNDLHGNPLCRTSVIDITKSKKIENVLTFLSQYNVRPGENFFQSLAKYLTGNLGMDYVCIDRLEGDNLTAHTLAVYFDGKFEDNVSYTLHDTPCGEVVGKTVCCFPSGVRHLFAKDAVLQDMMAESYAGVTLWGHSGQPIGLIAVIGRQPLENPTVAESVLRLVAVRAANELERKQAEEALHQVADELKRSNEDLKQFASAASHDLQEPLRGIESFIRLLEKRYKGKLDQKADEYIDYVVNDVGRMQMLIKDLLEYSRISVKEKVVSPVNCSVVLEQALSNLRSAIEESSAEVTYDLLPAVMGDEAQLSRLFQNLIGNAIKFRSKEPLKVHISADREENAWIFAVRDNSIGIDPKQAERIFLIFQRLHSRHEYPGTGVGLAVCKKIVERHEGRIWIESEPEKGATFFFTIPNRQGNLSDLDGEESRKSSR